MEKSEGRKDVKNGDSYFLKLNVCIVCVKMYFIIQI